MSIGHIQGKCQSGCNPLCFCSSGGIQGLEIETRWGSATRQSGAKGSVCAKRVIDMDGCLHMPACTDSAKKMKHVNMHSYSVYVFLSPHKHSNTEFHPVTPLSLFSEWSDGCTKPRVPTLKHSFISSSWHLDLMLNFHKTVSMLWILHQIGFICEDYRWRGMT